jgi:hypothetical protein
MQWSGVKGVVEIRSERDLSKRIGELDPATSPFGVLSRGGRHFIQVAAEGGGFVIEKREGGEDSHVHARRTGGRPSPKPPRPGFFKRLLGGGRGKRDADTFTLGEVEAVLLAWYEDRPDPDFLRWDSGPSCNPDAFPCVT